MEVVLIDNVDNLLCIENEWRWLYERIPEVCPFFSFEWVTNWIDTYLGENRLFILAIRNEKELVGLAPFYITKKAGLRVIQFLGLKWVNGERVTILAMPEDFQQVVNAIFQFLLEIRSEWDALSLYGIRANSLFQYSLFNDCPEFMNETRMIAAMLGLAPIISLECGWDDYLRGRSKRFRKTFKKIKKRCKKANIEIVCESKLRLFSSVVDRLLLVESYSWQGKQGTGQIARGKKFFKKILPYLLASGRADVIWAIKDNVPIAFKLILLNDVQAVFYVACYNSTFSDFSPGVMLQNFALESMVQIGVKQVDMMTDIGRIETHKKSWATDYEMTWKYVLYQKNIRGRVIAMTQL